MSEPGLYSLIVRSKRLEARAFKRWVTHDVLLTIRRTGRYEPAPVLGDALAELERQNQLTTRAIEIAKAERDRAGLAEQRAAALEPSATAWDVLAADTTGDYSVRDAAQILDRDPGINIGQNQLWETLRELRWVDATGQPYQAQVGIGRLVRRASSYRHPRTGTRVPSWQVRITAKGLAALRRHLVGEGEPALFDVPPGWGSSDRA